MALEKTGNSPFITIMVRGTFVAQVTGMKSRQTNSHLQYLKKFYILR